MQQVQLKFQQKLQEFDQELEQDWQILVSYQAQFVKIE
ncbi:protein of unknown function [Xenorhabdus doucetiae]|uniref:Uncharacterized protein n=1 Tax=Xenorhabdus doucetiae TaxID=351671 RepID=A0A068QVI7_9GAMM|nr:protein of unknown function [Xenorhabdus doucetiae]